MPELQGQPGPGVASNAADVWIDVSPTDVQTDGGGFADFERTFPLGTVVTLMAPDFHEGLLFTRWRVDGVLQPLHARSVQFAVSAMTTVQAVFKRPRSLDGDPAPAGQINPGSDVQ